MLSLTIEFFIVVCFPTETKGPNIEFSIRAWCPTKQGGIIIEFTISASGKMSSSGGLNSSIRLVV